MTTVANGLIGGLVVALVATGAARLVGDESSAVPTVVERVLGDRAPTARYAGIGLRLV